jgi:hypothetical protein
MRNVSIGQYNLKYVTKYDSKLSYSSEGIPLSESERRNNEDKWKQMSVENIWGFKQICTKVVIERNIY